MGVSRRRSLPPPEPGDVPLDKDLLPSHEPPDVERAVERVFADLDAGKTISEIREAILSPLPNRERRIISLAASGWGKHDIATVLGNHHVLLPWVEGALKKYRPEIAALLAVSNDGMIDQRLSATRARQVARIPRLLNEAYRIALKSENEQARLRAIELFLNRFGLPVTTEQNINVQTQGDYLMSVNVRRVLDAIEAGNVTMLDVGPPSDDEEVN